VTPVSRRPNRESDAPTTHSAVAVHNGQRKGDAEDGEVEHVPPREEVALGEEYKLRVATV
jgi:hypothetical protein